MTEQYRTIGPEIQGFISDRQLFYRTCPSVFRFHWGSKLMIVRQFETSNFPHEHTSPRYLSAWDSKKRDWYVSQRVGKPLLSLFVSFLQVTPFTTVSNMHLKITYKTTLFKALGGRITQMFEIVKLFSKIQAQI